MRTTISTDKREHSALNATKTVAKVAIVLVLLLATAVVVYLAS